MADRARLDLPYGHFGSAAYNPEEQDWSFERSLDSSWTLSLVGEAQTVLRALTGAGRKPSKDGHQRKSEIASVRRPKQINRLAQVHPEIQCAVGNLRPLLEASEAVETVTARHDPVKGNLLCFGKIPDELLRRPARIAALPSGPSGSDVRFVQVQLQKQGLDDSKDSWLEVPVFAGEEAIWRGDGSPVQQICFSSSQEGGENLVAVRYITRTLIFRPILQRLGPNRLHPRFLTEILIDQLVGAPHAHVAFNPWFTRQFAVIDQSGNWSIHEFATKATSLAARVHLHAWNEKAASQPNDGWARTVWVHSPNIIVVADRRRVTLFDISSGPVKLQDVNVGLTDAAGWILDLALLPSRSDRLCVLTTTHLVLVALTENSRRDVEARIVMRIQHFRSPEDISLRLNTFMDGTNAVILLQSALSPVLLFYRFASDSEPMRFSNVSEVQLPSRLASGVGRLHVQPLEYAEKPGRAVEQTVAGKLQKLCAHFVGLVSLSEDNSVHQAVCMSHDSVNLAVRIDLPSWQSKLGSGTSRLAEDFVMEDGSDDDDFLAGERPMIKHLSRVYLRTRRMIPITGGDRTINFHSSAEGIESPLTGTVTASDVLSQVHSLLDDTNENNHRPMQTLCELADSEVTVSDIDQISTQIKALDYPEPPQYNEDRDTQESDPSSRLKVSPIKPSMMLPAIDEREMELGSCYDNIVSMWISPLSNRIPGVVRLAKEQLARRMAVEVTLASHRLRYTIPEEPSQPTQSTEPEEQSQSQGQSWRLPVRGLPYSQASQSSFLPNMSQQSVLPTPSPTGTPSVTTHLSHASSFAAAEVSRLSKYTTFSKAAPTSIPRNLNKILAHWNIGESPEDYDWLVTSRRITQQTEEEEMDSQLTEKQRARLQRKADRHIRRQRREAAASQQQQIASSQMPELLVSGSRPASRADAKKHESQPASNVYASQGVVASSQSVMPGPASQALPVRAGGKMPVKKKRKQGF